MRREEGIFSSHNLIMPFSIFVMILEVRIFESFKIVNQQIYTINTEVLTARIVLRVYMSDPLITKS